MDRSLTATLLHKIIMRIIQIHQEAVINELKTKSQAVGEKKLLHQDEVYNGALEDILHGLRSEPYRRADAVRRSHRRRINSHRLSKGLEELDVWCEPPAPGLSAVQRAVRAFNARARRSPDADARPRASAYRVAPADCELDAGCELIKSTYDVISKYTRAMFEKQNETVVWTMCLFFV